MTSKAKIIKYRKMIEFVKEKVDGEGFTPLKIEDICSEHKVSNQSLTQLRGFRLIE